MFAIMFDLTNVREGEEMTEKLTRRQAEVLQEIRSFFRRERIAPTVRELASRLKVTPSTVHKLLRILREKGHIELRDNISRGIFLMQTPVTSVSVPILGHIPAGNPVLSEELYDGYLEIDSNLVPGGELFALRVDGESMIDANILDGDTAIIRQQEKADSGEIIAAMIDGKTTLKRLKITDNKSYLYPENPEFSPIEIIPDSEVVILGKLVAVVRKY